ncbi:muscarinic acetylcholine receptor M5 [Tetranychus urticae]|uniref:muscarinic acetylcholine receptor M5 n=1 Tax=Tetranychus urticae TaxID=32264 RepID=UPI00077B991A|nr:muscarinic acetylcholine receptor M5 [Tetranychus urticae]
MELFGDSSTITINLNEDPQQVTLFNNETWTPPTDNIIKEPETFSIAETIIIAFITGCFSIITIVGNVMVMISFKMDKQLQTISNYFLLSLSIADFLIGLISMPLFSLYTLLNRWPLGPFICDTWLAIDYLISNASVLNLLIISFDRYFSVTRPLTYRARRTTKKACIMIATTWIISLLLWPPWIFSWPYIEGKRTVPHDQCYIQFIETNSYITFGTAIAAFYIPLFVMIALYWRIWRETEKRYRDLTTLFLVSTVGASKGSSGNGFSGGARGIGGSGMVVLSRKNTSSSSEGQVITTTTTTTSNDKRSASFEAKSLSCKSTSWWLCWTKSKSHFTDCDCDQSETVSTGKGNRNFRYRLSHRKNKTHYDRNHSGYTCSKNNKNLNNININDNNDSVNNNNNDNNNNQHQLRKSSKDNTVKNVSSVNVASHNNSNKIVSREDDISPSQTSTGTGELADSLKGSESIYTIVIKLYGDEDHNHTIKMIEHSDTLESDKNLYCPGSTVADVQQRQQHHQPLQFQSHHYNVKTRHSNQFNHQHSLEQGSTSSGSTIAKSPGNLSISGSGSNPRRLTSNPSGTSIHPQQPKSERKAAKTLSAILLAFAITWTPYNVLVLINSLSGRSDDGEKIVPKSLWDFCYYLCYINSTINPLCYALCNATFRRTYIRILKCKWSSKKNKQHRRQKHWNLE